MLGPSSRDGWPVVALDGLADVITVDLVSGSSFTVTFSGTTAKVVLGPGALITKQTDVDPAQIPVGTKISATVRAGIAQSIQFQGP